MSDDRAVVDNIEVPENQRYFRTIVNYDKFVGLDENDQDVAENERSDLTGYSFRGQVVEKDENGDTVVVFDFNIAEVDLVNGEYSIEIEAADIVAKGPFEGWYDVFEQAPSGNEYKVLKGCFVVTDSGTGS